MNDHRQQEFDPEEYRAVEELKRRVQQTRNPDMPLPAAYWTNLRVRTNKRIDDATSARALSISWAARVAIPGVVAILFFYIGLHYYVPETRSSEGELASFVNTLPEDTVDSILLDSQTVDATSSTDEVANDIFDFSTEQIREYFLAAGNPQPVVETMSDSDVSMLLASLDTKVH